MIVRQSATIGAMRGAKAAHLQPEAGPIMMLCGLPVSVMALPMLELVASANRKGTADVLARSVISSSKGVPNKQTVSFSRGFGRHR